ncbi:MAG TPA: histidine phosphatase family protein [Methylomirabilota bacterium]|nr:histidine phosphatase family protein [Methylomirabilota bacterium]
MTCRALGVALRAGTLWLALLAPAAALAQPVTTPPLRGAELLATLRAGGHILYLRHADTDHGQNDQRMTSVEDCTTQRNLSARGRDRARAVGEAIRALRIPIGAVLASPLCRTVETAMLAFGAAQKSAAVREGGPLPPGSPGRFPALRALLSTPVAPGTNTVVVGHGYPYYTLVGGQYLSEGEADVVRPRGADFEVLARVDLDQWRALAAVPAGR